ncbi:MAG: DUF4623 domain-containing protein [Verrucomicrobia bacterium]|nr:DUF4623 domain-containing protein [Verrucomicrobiota bacterium]
MKQLCKCSLLSVVLLLAQSAWAQPYLLTTVWRAAVGDPNYPFLATDSTHRGLAYSAETTHLLVASRTGGNKVFILDSETGVVLANLQGMAAVSGGNGAAMNLVGAGEDGAVYLANLTTDSATSPLKLYRWASEEAEGPVVVYQGDPFEGAGGTASGVRRLGDTMAVRGSGMFAEVLLGTRSSTNVVLLRPSDSPTNFTSTVIGTDAAAGDFGTGLAWGAASNFWGKGGSRNLRRFNITPSNTAVTLNNVAGLPNSAVGIGFDAERSLLALVNYSAHNVVLYDVSNPAAPLAQATNTFATANANANGTTYAAFSADKLFALDSNNGIVASRVVNQNIPTPPHIAVQPANTTILEGGNADLVVGASGSQPLLFQWFRDGAPVSDATNATLSILSAVPSHSGGYFVIITNQYGAATSDVATFTVQIPVRTDALNLLWSLGPGSRPWLTADNTQRGIAYNKLTGNLLVVSRANSNVVAVLDGETGNLKHFLSMTGVTGGDFAINLVGVGDDGVVYACNLSINGTNTATPFKIYRWANDAPETAPTVAYSGDPGNGVNNRWGDTLDVRGLDIETGILVGSRNANVVVVFSTSDLANFTGQAFTVTNAPNGAFGLGVAWGDGQSFWGKSSGGNLYKIALDSEHSVGTVTLNFDGSQFASSVSPIAVDPDNGFLAGVSVETPDNLRLYDLLDVSAAKPPVWLDTEFFPADNANLNGTGAVDFGPARLFALDSNNGLMAFTLGRPTRPTLAASRLGSLLTLTYTGRLLSSTNAAGPYRDVPGASNPHSVDVGSGAQQFFRAGY